MAGRIPVRRRFLFQVSAEVQDQSTEDNQKLQSRLGDRRQPQGSVQNFMIVVETKGGLDIAKLRFASEGWKIRYAMRFFAELGISYRHVDGNTFTWAAFDGQSNLK